MRQLRGHLMEEKTRIGEEIRQAAYRQGKGKVISFNSLLESYLWPFNNTMSRNLGALGEAVLWRDHQPHNQTRSDTGAAGSIFPPYQLISNKLPNGMLFSDYYSIMFASQKLKT